MTEVTALQAASRLKAASSILILTHTSPDGDTIGSAFGLKHGLESLGKEVYVVCDDILPERLQFLADDAPSLSPSLLPEHFSPDLIVAVDIAALSLSGAFGQSLAGKIDLRLDHHASGTPYAAEECVIGNYGSCGELIFDILSLLNALSAEAAMPIYGAICSDTGCFRFSSVTPETHRKAARLLEFGIPHSAISERLITNHTIAETKALAVAYRSIHFLCNGKIAYLMFTNAMKQECGLHDENLGLINSLPRDIVGVSLSIVIKQKDDEPETFRISMRTDETIEANELCALFGGGGHARASGARITAASPEEAEHKIVNAVLAALGWEA